MWITAVTEQQSLLWFYAISSNHCWLTLIILKHVVSIQIFQHQQQKASPLLNHKHVWVSQFLLYDRMSALVKREPSGWIVSRCVFFIFLQFRNMATNATHHHPKQKKYFKNRDQLNIIMTKMKCSDHNNRDIIIFLLKSWMISQVSTETLCLWNDDIVIITTSFSKFHSQWFVVFCHRQLFSSYIPCSHGSFTQKIHLTEITMFL